MHLSVRQMRKEDLPQVVEIDREAFPTQWPPANYRQELQNQLARYLVVTDDTRTAPLPKPKPRRGLAKLLARLMRRTAADAPPPPPSKYIVGFVGIWAMADEAHITNIAVRREYQRRGIGELLLTSIIDLASGMNISVMTLEVRASNLSAQTLYRKYGFNQAGVRHAYYLDNKEDGIIMTTDSINSAPFRAHFRRLKEGLRRKWRTSKLPGEKPAKGAGQS